MLFICRREKFSEIICDLFNSLLIHFATRRYQSDGSSRLSSSALSPLAACALRKPKKSAGIVVIPLGEIRELLPEGSYWGRQLHTSSSERSLHEWMACVRVSFFFLSTILKLVSSTASGIPVLFPPLPLSSRHNFRNFRNESTAPPSHLLVTNRDQSSNTGRGQFRKLAALI